MPGPGYALGELGCGSGTDLLVAAACHPQARFVGIDANAQHIALAQAAAQAAGLDNVRFIHALFGEVATLSPDQLGGPLDVITCHGVWSWIAPAQRRDLLAAVTRHLSAHGYLLLHYMCHPGASELHSVQQLLRNLAGHVPGDSTKKLRLGMRLLGQLAERGQFADRPLLAARIAALQRLDPAHLAHEFLTEHWQPVHAADVHRELAGQGLHYTASADAFCNLDPALSIPGALQDIVRQTVLPDVAETLKDMARNSHQRIDLFQRPAQTGAAGLDPGTLPFGLLPAARVQGPYRFDTPIGPLDGPPALISAVLERLAQGPVELPVLAQLPACAGQTGWLVQTLQLLMSCGWIHPVRVADAGVIERCAALDAWFARHGVALRVHPQAATGVRID